MLPNITFMIEYGKQWITEMMESWKKPHDFSSPIYGYVEDEILTEEDLQSMSMHEISELAWFRYDVDLSYVADHSQASKEFLRLQNTED